MDLVHSQYVQILLHIPSSHETQHRFLEPKGSGVLMEEIKERLFLDKGSERRDIKQKCFA